MTIELLAEVSILREKVEKYEKAIEDIKDEIESHIIESNGLDFNSALYIALEIINKHIGGE